MAQTLRTYKGKTSTSCPNVSDWLAAYEGADEVYAITITGTLSGSYNAAQLAAELFNAFDDEILRPCGCDLLLPPGMVIVNFNKIIQDIFRLLRMGKPQRQLQQAAFLGIRPRYAQAAQHLGAGLLDGEAFHENGPAYAAGRKMGRSPHGYRGEGKLQRDAEFSSKSGFPSSLFPVGQGKFPAVQRSNRQGTRLEIHFFPKFHLQGSRMVKLYFPDIPLFPIRNAELQSLHDAPHHLRGLDHIALIRKIGFPRPDAQIGKNDFRNLGIFLLVVPQHDAGGLLIQISLPRENEISPGSAQQSGRQNPEPIPSGRGKNEPEGKNIVVLRLYNGNGHEEKSNATGYRLMAMTAIIRDRPERPHA